MTQVHPSAVQDAGACLHVVEARIAFFGGAELRRHYTGLLRELNAERQRLRHLVALSGNEIAALTPGDLARLNGDSQ